jgi:uncharacterized protein YndB with AHSA1/START domain
MNTTSTTRTKEKVVIERTYKADLQVLWDLWTTKKGFESWWGPEGFRADVQELDPREGGALRYDMVAHAPEMIEMMKKMGQPVSHLTRARFSYIKPRERLVLTNVIDFLPGVTAYEADMAVEFIPNGDRVRMVVTLDALHSDEFSKMQKEGLTSQLTKLDKRFA